MLVRCATLFAAIALLPALVPTAHAAYPGENGRIAYWHQDSGIVTANLDGTDRRFPTLEDAASDGDPVWSPSGDRIAFVRYFNDEFEDEIVGSDLYLMRADGAFRDNLTDNEPFVEDFAPTWSPDGTTLAFQHADRRVGQPTPSWCCGIYTYSLGSGAKTLIIPDGRTPAWSPTGAQITNTCGPVLPAPICVANSDGTDQRTITAITGDFPDWSPDGRRIVFEHRPCGGCDMVLYLVDADGSNLTQITTPPAGQDDFRPSFSPDGTKIIFGRALNCCRGTFWTVRTDGGDLTSTTLSGSEPGWQPLPVNTASSYARPKSANPVRVSLVPAYRECAAPNREHGPPLAFGSCAPPEPGSSHLMVGVGDGHPAPARSTGFVRLKVTPGVPGGEDDTTGRLRVSLTNVMRASDLSEYTGELRASVGVRITDREGAVSQTVQDLPLELSVPCLPTPDAPGMASVCDLGTDLDAVLPGATPEGTRAIWQLDRVKVYDGGPDEDADTPSDNSLFAVQGVFVP